jgi:hypothetical protein
MVRVFLVGIAQRILANTTVCRISSIVLEEYAHSIFRVPDWLRWKLTIIRGVLVSIGFYIVFVECWSVKTALTIATVQDLSFLRDHSCVACINCEVPLMSG